MNDPTERAGSPAQTIADMLSHSEAAEIDFDPPRMGSGRPKGAFSIAGGAGGKRVTLYLDDASLEVAKALGKGNISGGIRLALSLASEVAPQDAGPAEQRIGIAKGAFEVPDSIDSGNDEVSRLFSGKE